MENLKEKIQNLENQIATSPHQAGILSELSRLYWKQGAEEALRCLNKAFLLQPQSAQIARMRRELLFHGLFTLGSPHFRHGDGIRKIRTAPDGKVVSASYDKTCRIWDLSGKEILRLEGHQKAIQSFDFSWEKKWVATASEDKTCKIWDFNTGKEILTFSRHEDIVTSIAFSADGKQILSGSEDGTCRVWESETGKELLCFDKHPEAVSAVAFSSDGRLAVSGDWNGNCIVWIVESGKAGVTYQGHKGMILSLRFSANKRSILSAGEDGSIHLWDGAKGGLLRAYEGHRDSVQEANFSPDEKIILSCSFDKTIRLWDKESGKTLKQIELSHPVYSVALLSEEKYLVSGGRAPEIQLWSWETGKELSHPYGHQGKVLDLDVSGSTLATVGSDDTSRLWDLKGGLEIGVLEWTNCRGRSLSFSPDGKNLVVAGEDHVARVWDLETRKVTVHLEDHKGAILSVFYHPKTNEIISCDNAGCVILWDGSTGSVRWKKQLDIGPIYIARFFPSGEFVALGGDKNTALVLDVSNGVEFARFSSHSAPIWNLCVTKDEQIVTVSLDHTMKIWEGTSSQEIGQIPTGDARIYALVTLGNSPVVASGDERGFLRFWNVKSYKEVNHLNLGEPILSLGYDRERQELLAGLSNGCIRRVLQFEMIGH